MDMAFVQIFWYYIVWHYTKAFRDIFRITLNYLWFIENFFSINLLMRTLISPWRRLSISGGKGKEDSFFGAFLINTLMRLVGFLIRSVTIIFGALSLLATFALGFIFIILWLFLPFIIFILFLAGTAQFIKSI